VITQNEVFEQLGILPQDEDDTVWLAECRKQQWIGVTKDRNIRRRTHEIEAYREAGVPLFVWTSKKATGPEMAQAIAKAHPRMVKRITQWVHPFMARVTPSGKVEPFGTVQRRSAVRK
tara:strand:- start:1684 stop:2037 length:354 start_codon:yes stop_codon:yes gene_type:complete